MLKFIGVVVVLLLGAAAYKYGFDDLMPTAEQPALRTVTVEQGDVENVVRAIGRLKAFIETPVSASMAGIVTGIEYQSGDTVEKGAPVATINAFRQKSRVEGLEFGLSERRAAIDAAQIERDFLIDQREVQSALRERGVATPQALARLEADIGIARAKLAQAQALLEAKLAELRVEQEILDFATTLLSPHNGTVVSVNSHEGRLADPAFDGGRIMTVADISRLKVEIQITEADIARIKPGINARISLPGDTEPRFTLPIERIQPLPKVFGGINLYVAEVTIENADGALRIAQNAEVQVVTDQFPSVVHLRNEAIGFVDGQAFVAVTTDGQTYELQPIETRYATRFVSIIEQGVEAGATVVTPFPQDAQ
jgi:macrolide-specific efflux system membrane fusion protein